MIRDAILVLALTAVAFAGGRPADLSGEYKGTYTSDSGSSDGKIHTVLKKNTDNSWDCKFSFTNASGAEVETKVISCAADDNKLKGEYTANVDGTDIKVSLDGTLADDNMMSGTYKAYGTDGEVVDSGKWKAGLSQ